MVLLSKKPADRTRVIFEAPNYLPRAGTRQALLQDGFLSERKSKHSAIMQSRTRMCLARAPPLTSNCQKMTSIVIGMKRVSDTSPIETREITKPP